MNSNGYILRLDDLSVGYDKPLLKHISLRFTAPMVIGLIGNNGKGKTTLLRSLSGLHRPDTGKILLNEADVYGLTSAGRSRLISLNFSSNHISFPVSVFELVSMGRYPYNNHWAGLTENDRLIIENALEQCQALQFKEKPVTSLSDGERQKVFIAKSIAQQTPVMLFDEPTAFLDYASKKHFFQVMKKLAEDQERIIVISSHDIDFLTAYADNLLMIGNEETVLFGSTEDISQTTYFKDHFTKK